MVSVSRTEEVFELLRPGETPPQEDDPRCHPMFSLVNELVGIVKKVEKETENSGKAILKITLIDNVLADKQCDEMTSRIDNASAQVTGFEKKLHAAAAPNATAHRYYLEILDIIGERLRLLKTKSSNLSCYNQVIYNSARTHQRSSVPEEAPKQEQQSHRDLLKKYQPKEKPALTGAEPASEITDGHMSNEMLQMSLKSDTTAYKEFERGLQIISSLNEAIESEVSQQVDSIKDIDKKAEEATEQLIGAITNLTDAEKVKWTMKKILTMLIFFIANLLVVIHTIRP